MSTVDQPQNTDSAVIGQAFPDLCGALEAGLRLEDDTWDKSVLHVSDLGYTIPGSVGLCAAQLWKRVHGKAQREHHRGELLMFDHGKEIHLRLTTLIGAGLERVAPGWKIALVEHSIRTTHEDLGLLPDPDEIDAGRLDVEMHGPAGQIVIVDYKTVRGDAFQYLDAEGASPRNVLQVQTYIRKRDAIGGLLFYVDREGQNFARQFPVLRDDAAVVAAAKAARAIADAAESPAILEPSIKRVENKTMDSVYLKAPWQCGRCVFLDHSCPGALPPDVRDYDRVAANISKSGELTWKPDVPEAAKPIITRLLWGGAV